MHVKAIIHEEEDCGYWAEVSALPGCATQGETMEELLANLREAIEGYLSVPRPSASARVAAGADFVVERIPAEP